MSCEDATPITRESLTVEGDAATNEEFAARCERLYQEHNKALLSLLVTKLHSYADAMEVAQEAYLRLLQHGAAETITHLRGWLFKTSLNIATDRIRKRIRLQQDQHFLSVLTEPDDAPSAECLCIVDEDWECLQRAVDELPPKCRQALILVEFDCRTAVDVAAQLGVKVNTVYQLVKRAYEHLAKASFAISRDAGGNG